MINFTKPQFWSDLPYLLVVRVANETLGKNISSQDLYESLSAETLDEWAQQELKAYSGYVNQLKNFLDTVS